MCLEFRKEDRLEDKFKSYLVMSEIDSQTENKHGCWRGGIVREFGMDMYTLLHFKWIINKDLLYNT